MDGTDPVIGRFYDAIGCADREALLATLTEDFVGHVTDGLPDIGGVHTGPEAMLAEVWVPAHLEYRVSPRPEEAVVAADGTTVVLGRYCGAPPSTDISFDAVFAHLFRLRDGRIAELRQVTDSHRWVAAAAVEALTSAVATQVFDAVRARDIELLLDAYAPGIVIEDDPRLPYGGTYRGREGVLAHAAGYVDAWDRFQDDATRDPGERLLASGDTVVALWTLQAARNGQQLSVPAASRMTFEDRKVVHLRMHYADSGAAARFLDGA